MQGPGGAIVAGPVADEDTTVYGEIDLQKVRSSRRSLDVAGHHNRPDVFRLSLDQRRRSPVEIED